MRRLSNPLLAVFGAACVFYVLAISPFRPWPQIVSTTPDDAAYYFKIGLNYVNGLGLTFDGRNPTNGFQPFWQALIAGMQKVLPFRLEPEQFVRAVLVFQGLLLAAALVVFNRTLRLLDNSLVRRLGTALFLTILVLMIRNGMESALLVALAAIAVYVHAQDEELAAWSGRRCIGFGVLLGAVMLARLDSIFWIIGVFVILVLIPGNGQNGSLGLRLRKASWIGLACAAVLTPYLVSNYLAFGHFMPISGALKSSFPKAGFNAPDFSLLPDDRALLVLAVILSAACLLWEFGPWPSQPGWALRGPACAIAIGVLLHVGYAVLFMKWAVFSWHFVLERFAVCLLLVALLNKFTLENHRVGVVAQRWAIGVLVTVLAFAAPLFAYEREWRADLSHSWRLTAYEAAKWAKANLPADAVIAMTDAGNMGFHSGRPVVNLDGLVNSFAYQEALKEGKFREFLRDSGVNYFAQHAVGPEVTSGEYDFYTFRSFSRLYDRFGGDLRLNQSREVYRSPPYYYDGSKETVLVIWRIAPGDLGD